MIFLPDPHLPLALPLRVRSWLLLTPWRNNFCLWLWVLLWGAENQVSSHLSSFSSGTLVSGWRIGHIYSPFKRAFPLLLLGSLGYKVVSLQWLDWCSKHQLASAMINILRDYCKKKTNLHLQWMEYISLTFASGILVFSTGISSVT